MNQAVLNKAKKIKLVATDVDGVWTDSKMYYAEQGLFMKSFSTYDGMAAHLLHKYDFIIAMITSEYEHLDILQTRVKKLHIQEVYTNEHNKINLLFDVNRLMVAKYAQMDWNGDGLITTSKETGFSDPWYKAIVTCWLDDWYYTYDRDYDTDGQIGGYFEMEGTYKAFSGLDEYTENDGYFYYSSSLWGDQKSYTYQLKVLECGSEMACLTSTLLIWFSR